MSPIRRANYNELTQHLTCFVLEQQMLQDQHNNMKHNKARSKSRAKELPLPRHQSKHNQKRKTGVDPSSKLLDITALKQQPKLF